MDLGATELKASHRNTGLDDEIASSWRGSVFLDIPFYRTGFRETVNRRGSLSENPTHEVLSRMGGSPTIQSISQGETRNPRAIAFKKRGALAWKALLRLDG